MAEYKIERLGGFAGFGLPGSHLASRGRIAAAQLEQQVQDALEALFAKHAKARRPATRGPARDMFSYRITRTTDSGEQSIEVPEADVPGALINCIKDELI
ncbi:MAG: hypothetical protein KF778_06100 [Rhodocyclaceae bacterium]|nr:hypothetical protein [Rhodocyclaceae bacterium]MBX3667958.1 hypothetical protein [Rhodocyclaceae bacterium]